MLSKIMKNWKNPQTKSAKEHFSITPFNSSELPCLDNLLHNLESRIDDNLLSVYYLDVMLQYNSFLMTNKIRK